VIRGRYLWAAATSLCQSMASLTLFKLAPAVSTPAEMMFFAAGGVLGGQASMLITRRRRKDS
jgi:hypothetical protein